MGQVENPQRYAGQTMAQQPVQAPTPDSLAIPDNRTVRIKELRVGLDAQLQIAKDYKACAQLFGTVDEYEQAQQCCFAIENAIMRLGMCLKAIGNPNPYPNSYNPQNTVIDPTADGLKL